MTLIPADIHHAAKIPLEKHALLPYPDTKDNNNKAATKYVNEALSRGQLTVYIRVNPNNNNNNNNTSPQISEMVSENTNYEDNVNRGNLLTFDTGSFYNSALDGNMEPFEELKILLEEAIRERRIASGKKNNDELTIVGEIAGTLAANQKFEESINLEKWWQKTHSEWLQKGLKITTICPHPSTIFDNNKTEQFIHYRQAMSSLHQVVLEPSSGS